MFELKVLLRHPSALIPRTADNKGSSKRSVDLDDLIVLDDIDLENLDDLGEGGGVDDLVRLGPLHDHLGAGHQRLAVHRGQAQPGQGDGWIESLIRKIKCFIFFYRRPVSSSLWRPINSCQSSAAWWPSMSQYQSCLVFTLGKDDLETTYEIKPVYDQKTILNTK